MSFQLSLAVTIEGSVFEGLEKERRAGSRAVTEAMQDAGLTLKNAWRAQVQPALGPAIAKSIRQKVYPSRGVSIDAATMVYSKAGDIVESHDKGVTIRARNTAYLAIPLPAAGRAVGTRNARTGRFEGMTPAKWEKRTGMKLRFVYRRTGPSLLVAEGRVNRKGIGVGSRSKTGRGLASIPIFILVPQVKLRKRYDLARDVQAAGQSLPGLIVSKWDRMVVV